MRRVVTLSVPDSPQNWTERSYRGSRPGGHFPCNSKAKFLQSPLSRPKDTLWAAPPPPSRSEGWGPGAGRHNSPRASRAAAQVPVGLCLPRARGTFTRWLRGAWYGRAAPYRGAQAFPRSAAVAAALSGPGPPAPAACRPPASSPCLPLPPRDPAALGPGAAGGKASGVAAATTRATGPGQTAGDVGGRESEAGWWGPPGKRAPRLGAHCLPRARPHALNAVLNTSCLCLSTHQQPNKQQAYCAPASEWEDQPKSSISGPS